MPTVWSKLLDPKYSHELSCHETYHTWTKSCSEAANGFFFSFFEETFKIYITLNILNQTLIRRKYQWKDFLSSFNNSCRSSFFMSFTPFMVMSSYCWLRNSSDRFYYWIQLYIPPALGTFLGILIESGSRREALTVFSCNIASDMWYGLFKEKTGLPPLYRGTAILFALSMFMFFHSYEVTQPKNGLQASVMDFLLGIHDCDVDNRSECLLNGIKSALMTFTGTGLLQCFLSIINGSSLTRASMSRPLFLTSFVGLFHLSRCLLTHNLPRYWVNVISGLAASSSMLIQDDRSIALYSFWKSLQLFISCYASYRTKKNVNFIVFVISCSQLFHSMTMHPHLVRRGYISFIDRLSGGKIREINRASFEVFRNI